MGAVKVARLITEEVETVPETLQEGVIYVSQRFGTAIHLCACGCGGETVTPFIGATAWDLSDGPNGVTLRPSIGNQNFPCRSHYWITDGAVEWC